MIIGLSGQAGSGKSTVASFLVEHHGFVEVCLADEIKRTAKRWWDFTDDQMWGPSEMRNVADERYTVPTVDDPNFHTFLSPRRALQQIGTEVARAIDPDVWVRYTMNVAKKLLLPPRQAQDGNYRKYRWDYDRVRGLYENDRPVEVGHKGVVISDCRFKNEFAAIKDAGGKVVRIHGREAEWASGSTHASEAEQREVPDDYFHYLVGNTGDLKFLEALTARMIDVFKGNIRKYDPKQKDVPPFMRK